MVGWIGYIGCVFVGCLFYGELGVCCWVGLCVGYFVEFVWVGWMGDFDGCDWRYWLCCGGNVVGRLEWCLEGWVGGVECVFIGWYCGCFCVCVELVGVIGGVWVVCMGWGVCDEFVFDCCDWWFYWIELWVE